MDKLTTFLFLVTLFPRTIANEVKVLSFSGEGDLDDITARLSNPKTFDKDFEELTVCFSFLLYQMSTQSFFAEDSVQSSIR